MKLDKYAHLLNDFYSVLFNIVEKWQGTLIMYIDIGSRIKLDTKEIPVQNFVGLSQFSSSF